MNKPYLIGIVGGSGSGKSYFLENLKMRIPKDCVCYISLDNYYKALKEQVKDENGEINFDLPTALDAPQLIKDIERLQKGESVWHNEYIFNNYEAKEQKKIEIKSAPIIIIEGLFVFHYEELYKRIDLKIFVESREANQVQRRINRDCAERGCKLEDVLYRYRHHILPAYDQFVGPFKEQADIIINNNYRCDEATTVVAGFINNKLK